MDSSATPHLVHLSPVVPGRRALRIPRPRGYRVVAISGDVWVTQERRRDDIVLRPGDAARLDGDGLALVTAFDSADVEVIPPTPAAVSLADADFAALERSARRMRAAAVHGLLGRGLRWLRDRFAGQRSAA